jgi:hypothetical protein
MYTIHNESEINVEHRKRELDSMIGQEPSQLELEFGDHCHGEYHEPSCPSTLDGSPCELEIALWARKQKEALAYLGMFKTCLKYPWRANHYKLLEGIAQDKSLVYDNRSVQLPCPDFLNPKSDRDLDRIILSMIRDGSRFSAKVRGIKVTMGWDFRPMTSELSKSFAWLCLVLSVIWLGIVVWAEKFKDWSTAMAFGQVIAACISLVVSLRAGLIN